MSGTHHIFCIMGKSASGKDTVYEHLFRDPELDLSRIVMYTTRPIRDREYEGKEYHFVSNERREELERQGKIIEQRYYDTVYGRWYYFTVDDGQIDLESRDYLIPGVLNSYLGMTAYFGADKVIPLYIEVEDGERLQRAIRREKKQQVPKYEEMCRRFLSDTKDFSEENLLKAGISTRFDNTGALDDCMKKVRAYIQAAREESVTIS